MNKEEAKQLIARSKRYLKKVLVSKQTALDALVRAGLVTKSGRPTKLYASSSKNNFYNSGDINGNVKEKT